ncbi:MAG: rhodanese [Phycisphaerales bacterium]|nr:rhodanese [Phycisphaerales bacterium]
MARERLAEGKGGSERPLLLDVRRPDEFAVAKIQGAALVPMNEVGARLDEIEQLAGEKSGEIIVHCHHGRRSLTVTQQLREAGFTNVKSMAGGIDVWSIDIDPRVPRY